MTKKAFLHPSQRSLKTEQIGPSGHKNEFHVGVLEGNWQEERHTFGPQPAKNSPFTGTTTQRTSYQPASSAQLHDARPPEAYSQEAPRQLLFGHGKQVKSFLTVSELAFGNPRQPPALKSEQILSTEGTSPRRSRSNSKRREAGLAPSDELDGTSASSTSAAGSADKSTASSTHLPPVGVLAARDRFTTSKNVTVDATGEFLQTHPEAREGHSTHTTHRGQFLKSLNSSMHNTHFREHLHPGL